GPGHPLDFGLSAELALGADLAGDAGDLRGEGRELVDHAVDGARRAQELAFELAPFDLERHALCEVALSHRADHPRHLARRVHEIVDQRIDRLDRRAPEPLAISQYRPLLELAFLADHPRQPRNLLGPAG